MKRFSLVLLSSTAVAAAALLVSPPARADEKCGEKGQPSCPLQGWMEKNMQPAFDKEDTKALAVALEKAAGFVPDKSWKSWEKIAKDGAAAAKAGDFKTARNACKSCHKEWRKKYKAEHRQDPIKG